MPSDTPLLSVENMCVDIPTAYGTLHAVRNVSFDLRKGETLGIVGESGSGKSLTALSLLSLLPKGSERSADKILFDGADLQGFTERQMAKQVRGKRITMIFQEPMTSLNPVYSIGQQMTETMILHQSVTYRQASQHAVDLLERVGISSAASRLNQYPHQFSGGQRQRIMIAMALMNEPDLIIADEPTTALDVTIQAQILHLLVELQQELGMAMILITHDLGVVARMAGRLAVMYAGEIVEMGSANTVFGSPSHPYTKGLLACIPDVSTIQPGEHLGVIPGIVPSMIGDIAGCAFAHRCSVARPSCTSETPNIVTSSGQDHSVSCTYAKFPKRDGYAEPAKRKRLKPAHAKCHKGSRRAPRADSAMEMVDIHHSFDVRRGIFGKKSKLHAVRGVSLELMRGETLALVGESGCGKSTLARILMGLLDPDKGQVFIDSQPLAGEALKEVARRVQPIFQDPYSSLNPRRSIGQIIGRPLEIHEIGTSAERGVQVEEIMERVGLPHRLVNRYPNQLSGGQRQRVAIARAIIMRPEIVICDEPTSALDVSVQSQILNLLLDLRDELGLTYLLITHDLSVVRHMADRVAVMYLGEIVEQGEAQTLFSTPKHPYTKALLESVLTLTPGAGIPDNKMGSNYPNPLDVPCGCAFHTRCPSALAHCGSIVPQTIVEGDSQIKCHLFGESILNEPENMHDGRAIEPASA